VASIPAMIFILIACGLPSTGAESCDSVDVLKFSRTRKEADFLVCSTCTRCYDPNPSNFFERIQAMKSAAGTSQSSRRIPDSGASKYTKRDCASCRKTEYSYQSEFDSSRAAAQYHVLRKVTETRPRQAHAPHQDRAIQKAAEWEPKVATTIDRR